MIYVGSHINSYPQELLNNIKLMKLINSNAIQIFVYPNKIGVKNIYNKVREYCQGNNIKIIVHASYTINIASGWNEHSSHLIQFISEIKMAEYIGAKYIIVHFGKYKQLELNEAYNNMYTFLIYVYSQIKDLKIKILLETTSGQGTELCYKIDTLAYFMNKILKHKNIELSNKFGICVDTCHIYAAGYNILDYIDKFDELIGLEYIDVIHFNDSKVSLGDRVDRHENIGKGKIGSDDLYNFCKYALIMKCIIIMETPDVCEKVIDRIRKIK